MLIRHGSRFRSVFLRSYRLPLRHLSRARSFHVSIVIFTLEWPLSSEVRGGDVVRFSRVTGNLVLLLILISIVFATIGVNFFLRNVEEERFFVYVCMNDGEFRSGSRTV